MIVVLQLLVAGTYMQLRAQTPDKMSTYLSRYIWLNID